MTDTELLNKIEATAGKVDLPQFSRFRQKWEDGPWKDSKRYDTFREAVEAMPMEEENS